ncbi:MAG: hypothetical protein AMS17_07460 [Spirochaetes bacterium DG_61]|nr:MAG: hypothetical protein AMS17_07460 [Spirochaetes bacterium DG_61]
MRKINIVLTGHTSVGKTSFLDTALYDMGVTDTLGKVDDGKSLSDFDEEEIKRRISIKSSIFSTLYRDTVLNFLDTPGSADFAGEVVSALYGADSMLLLIDAVNGVEIETSKLWSRAQKMEYPVLFFVNKIDKENADYKSVLENIRTNLKAHIFPVVLPVGKGNSFNGLIDLIEMKYYTYEGGKKKGKEQDIPQEHMAEAQDLRGALIEIAAESTDELTEKYLEGETLSDSEVLTGLQQMIQTQKASPVFFGSCALNRGISETLDLIIQLAPSSNYRGKIKVLDYADASKEVEIAQSKDASFAGIVIKTVIDQFAGKITFLRVLSGSFKPEEDVMNCTQERKERLSKLSLPFGKNQVALNRNAEEGDIITFTKLPFAETGDTLSSLERPIKLPEMQLPNPIYSLAIKAKNKKEEDKLNSLLQRAAEEDISFKVEFNNETKQTVISGMGEQQINIILSRIKEKNAIEVVTSTPLVAYRETVTTSSKADYKHKKQSGGHGQYGQVFLEIEPLERGGGFAFIDKIVGGAIPKQYIPGVEKGVKEALEEGVVAGYPVVDVRTALVFGSFHEVDSSELSFKIAGRQAFKLAMEKAKPTLLEPIMDLRVYVNDKYTGDIMSDLNSKRGRVLGMDNVGGGIQMIKAKVPMAELLKYAIELRAITSGTGSFEMEFSNYEPIGGKIAEDIIKETMQRREELAKEK